MPVYSVIQGGDIAIADIREEGTDLLGLEVVLEDGVVSGEEAVGAVRSEGDGRVVIGLHELVCVLGTVDRVDCVEDVVNSVGGQQRQARSCTHHAFVVEMDFFGAKIILHFIFIISLSGLEIDIFTSMGQIDAFLECFDRFLKGA